MGLFNESSSTAWTAEASNSLTSAASAGSTESGYGTYTGTVTAATPVTVGASAPTGNSTTLAAYEVPPSGGSTPAIDGTSPAFVQGSSSPATTASFTPPAGVVVLAAVIAASPSSGTPSVTDTSGLGLVWTPRASYADTGNGSAAYVYTTSMGGTNTSPAYAASYDTTAVSGTGTWVNPADAEGTGTSPYATWTAP